MRPEDKRYMAMRLREAELGVARPKPTGLSQKFRTCDKCGKTGLDKTIEIKMPDGTTFHYGTECARFILQDRSNEPSLDELEEQEDDSSEGSEELDEEDNSEIEEFEEEELIPTSQYEPKEYEPYESAYIPPSPLPNAADKLSVDNFDTRFQIGGVIFDTREGLGHTPEHANVRYLGFGALMNPSKFLELCTPRGELREDDVSRLEDGRLNPGWSPPMLCIDITDGTVTGHEGGNRVSLFQKMNPSEKILVHFLVIGGVRARDLSKESIKKINQGLVGESFFSQLTSEQKKDPAQKKKYFVKGPVLSEAFLNREQIKT